MRNLLQALSFFSLFAIVQSAFAFDPSLPAKLNQRIASIDGSTVAMSLVQLSTGKEIFAKNDKKPLIPASVLKLFTSATALKVIGADYQFPTEIFILNKDGESPDLFFRGYGDPSLLQENLLELAQAVRHSGIKKIKNLIVDDTLFIDPPAATGIEPYQAALGSLSVNNNSFFVGISPGNSTGGNVTGGNGNEGHSGSKANIFFNPGLAYKISNGVNTLSYKGESIAVSFSPRSENYNPKNYGIRQGSYYLIPEDPVVVNVTGRINKSLALTKKYFAIRNPVRYFAALAKYYLKLAGVEVEGELLKGETPGSAAQVYIYKSKPLKEILKDLNHFSSNYIAGQLVYAMGQDSKGYFRSELGLEKIRASLLELGDDFKLVDGSGLSRENQLTANALTNLLVNVFRDYTIYPDFISSLSRFGISGTLSDRKLYDSKLKGSNPDTLDFRNKKLAGSVWAKTGTLDGVSSIAGYLQDRDGERMAFSIIINGIADKATATTVENSLIKEVLGLAQ